MPFSSSLTSKSRPQSGQLTISPEMTSSGMSISPSHSGHLALKVTASFHFYALCRENIFLYKYFGNYKRFFNIYAKNIYFTELIYIFKLKILY